ncbi:hypothetical protein FVEN_g4343 [Fusarium venenatum]|uniref:Uncharacterized protein n=1 Tax=Fusarium venenatum TaxID=56646 RepID=A0A2L2TRI7_9HYPO|nr:uncharacterized protein FVRRES_02778 [Fusarium venenatum]KAG8357672.1 hypothetical protein FVEN_g4343 [Fusarium venenatum]CEI66266.1 unnamed protein product [Fusarium venenatum]
MLPQPRVKRLEAYLLECLSDVSDYHQIFLTVLDNAPIDREAYKLIHKEYKEIMANMSAAIAKQTSDEIEVERNELEKPRDFAKALRINNEKAVHRNSSVCDKEHSFWGTILQLVNLGPKGVTLLKGKMENNGYHMEQIFSEVEGCLMTGREERNGNQE